ncbi:trypsin domain protein [Sulfurihydrogenibium azorense Az-Fu1]|uniref:Trypsin domain protein n=1 Tax=Sulfurihydrogenibium azorense (strain DSM 15241 / OCM 825 / Az-Fu1) TaxID=204536 RepID=C1DVG1_SULAA|nr:trypsin-like peptidase domain-containing protein [Sulfurihydrogenibium azorense]ACN98589.1 trypsin domain protein [Sulfurihydrogenibium azorense Az-Fu1]
MDSDVIKYRLKLIVLTIILLSVLSSCEKKKEKDVYERLQERVEGVIKDTTPSIVTIFTKPKQNQQILFKDFEDESVGSGFVFKKTQTYIYIATNAHVIEKANQVFVRFYNDRVMKAEIVGIDNPTDIAVLRLKLNHLNKNVKTLQFENIENVRPGMFVLAAGSPYNLGHTYTFGIVSALDREVGISEIEGYIQTDAAINPGDSGGPLLNLDGKVVGMNIATVQSGQGLGFAIPSDVVNDVVNQLIKYGKVSRGYIGITIADLSEELKEKMDIDQGVIVLKVKKKSPADESGIKEGDIITKFNGNLIRNSKDFKKMFRRVKPGDMIEFEVISNKNVKTITVVAQEKS